MRSPTGANTTALPSPAAPTSWSMGARTMRSPTGANTTALPSPAAPMSWSMGARTTGSSTGAKTMTCLTAGQCEAPPAAPVAGPRRATAAPAPAALLRRLAGEARSRPSLPRSAARPATSVPRSAAHWGTRTTEGRSLEPAMIAVTAPTAGRLSRSAQNGPPRVSDGLSRRSAAQRRRRPRHPTSGSPTRAGWRRADRRSPLLAIAGARSWQRPTTGSRRRVFAKNATAAGRRSDPPLPSPATVAPHVPARSSSRRAERHGPSPHRGLPPRRPAARHHDRAAAVVRADQRARRGAPRSSDAARRCPTRARPHRRPAVKPWSTRTRNRRRGRCPAAGRGRG